MPAKVFISCGQGIEQERAVAKQLGDWFASVGFKPYVAIEIQSILDLNAGIIGELKTSDYYLFVNFRRENVTAFDGNQFCRGSLYTNQELSIAYALGFNHMLLINQKGCKPEGVFKFIVTNVPEFNDYNEVLPRVQEAVKKAAWKNTYSRQLVASGLRLAQILGYRDHTGTRVGRTFHIDIHNLRPDQAATHCAARLRTIHSIGGNSHQCPDQSPLKVSGQPGYSQSIWPETRGVFDLLSVSQEQYPFVYLNSALDVIPRQPVITTLGTYRLDYEIYAEAFPRLCFTIDLRLDANGPHAELI